MKIFITGATGFIGKALTQALLKREWTITALTRTGGGLPAGVQAATGDIADRESMRAAMAGADIVYHNAGFYQLGITGTARANMHTANVVGTENVLGLAHELKIPKIVYTSSTTAIGDTGGVLADESFTRLAPPHSVYEQTKAQAHAIALDYQKKGTPVVIVCPAQVIGPGDHSSFGHFARLYVRGLLPPVIWAPEAIFTFGYIDDVAEGMALAGEKGNPGETYFLAGDPVSNRHTVQLWKKAVGGIPPFIWLPRPLATIQAALIEPILRAAGLPAFISREVVASSFVCFRYSSDKAKKQLGWQHRNAEQAWTETLLIERARAKK